MPIVKHPAFDISREISAKDLPRWKRAGWLAEEPEKAPKKRAAKKAAPNSSSE